MTNMPGKGERLRHRLMGHKITTTYGMESFGLQMLDHVQTTMTCSCSKRMWIRIEKD